MFEEEVYFLREEKPAITAAIAGITISRCEGILIAQTKEDALSFMSQKRYDIISIKGDNNEVVGFYSTREWNQYNIDNIEEVIPDKENSIYYLTNIRDVIKKFAKEKRNFYFLNNYEETIGIISIVNLRCKQVYLYFYHLVIVFERALSGWLFRKYTEESIRLTLESRVDSKSTQDTIARYTNDKQKGVESNLKEYLYLSELIFLVKDKGLFTELGFVSKAEFKSSISSVIDVRNLISHSTNDISRIDKVASLYWNAIFTMENIITKTQ